MTQPHKVAQDETQGRGNGLGGLALGTAGAAGAGGIYYGSHRLDRFLSENGFRPGGPSSLVPKAGLKFLRAVGQGNAAGLANYADAAADMLNGRIARGLTGKDSLKVIGSLLYRAGRNSEAVPHFGKRLSRLLRGLGVELRADYSHPHFSGFPTAGQGVRTLVNENADYYKLTLQNLGRALRQSLAANGWQANTAAAKAFDARFRKILAEGYDFNPSPTRTKDIKPILEAVLAKVGPKASANQIAKALQPGAAPTTVLADAVKPVLGASPRSRDVIAALMKTPAGMLAVQAASHTTRQCAGTHLGELTALGLIKALRSRKLRAGAGIAGGLSLAGGIYSVLRNKNKPGR